MTAKKTKTPPGDPVSTVAALEGAPWFVKIVIWFLMWFGFPVALCVFFLMLIVGYIPSPLTALERDMRTHMDQMKRVLDYVDTSTRVNRQVCRNTSTNPAERVECDR